MQQRATTVTIDGACLNVCNQWAYADNRAGAIDRLLIHAYFLGLEVLLRFAKLSPISAVLVLSMFKIDVAFFGIDSFPPHIFGSTRSTGMYQIPLENATLINKMHHIVSYYNIWS